MTTKISKKTANIIASSLPLMRARRSELEAGMARYMGRNGPYDPSKGRHEVTTGAILDMMFDHAGRIAETGEIAPDGQHGLRHRQLAIGGEHYSSFGDGLGAVMKDALGSGATESVLSAWNDAFWAITRTVAAEPAAMAA